MVSKITANSGATVADVPAGGGYLQNYLPSDLGYLRYEPCSSFSDSEPLRHHEITELTPLPWADGVVDVLVSLAGLHHTREKSAVFSEFYRVVRSGGEIIISDVSESSPVARFLDEFVGKFNSTGHAGIYLNQETPLELEASGWTILSCQQNDFDWHFESTECLSDFCRQLFDIRNISDYRLKEEIKKYVGFEVSRDQSVKMRWSLMTIHGKK